MATGRLTAVRPSPVFLAVVALAIAGGVVAWRADDPKSATAHAGVFVLVLAGWVVSLCLHEFAHAYLAWRAGDHEVAIRGYLTLNPLKYSHWLLSIALPLVFIALGGIGLPGGAVYVHPGRFSPRVQRWISLSGPMTNLVFAVLLLAVIRTFGPGSAHEVFWYGLSFLAFLQITATVLNLLPVPGLDGYGALEPSLSPQTRRALEQYKPYGLLAVMALLFVPSINTVFFDAVYWLFELSGLPDYWAGNGAYLTRFWL